MYEDVINDCEVSIVRRKRSCIRAGVNFFVCDEFRVGSLKFGRGKKKVLRNEELYQKCIICGSSKRESVGNTAGPIYSENVERSS